MLTISNYHYIRLNFEAKYSSIFGVTPNVFKNQLELLENQGDFISIFDLLNNTDTILAASENYFLITFDDGLKEQMEYAMPILENKNIDALFFANSINFENKKVSTVHKIHLIRSILDSESILNSIQKISLLNLTDIDKKNASQTYRFDTKLDGQLKYSLNFKLNLNEQERLINSLFDMHFNEQEVVENFYMSQKDLNYLASKNYLGSHTHSHKPLGILDNETILFELQHSKNYFENLTNSKINTVSYPYGTEQAVTPIVPKLALENGYNLGFTTKVGVNDQTKNKLLLNRFDCNDLIGGKNYKL